MHRYLEELKDFSKKGDMFLLVLALIVASFGLVAIASATSADKFDGNFRYIAVQSVSICLGVLVYAVVSSIDLDFLSEHRLAMVVFNCMLLLMLLSPLGTDNDSGNRSWIDLGVINVQPAEICKITYILIMASVMSSHQNRISHPVSVAHMLLHLGLLVGLNLVVSSDMGVSLIFVFIFIGMTFAGGVSLWWFAAALTGIAAMAPILWQFLDGYQRNRILILFDDSIDPQGINERYHSNMNLKSLTGGGLTGQGLFNGNRTQGGNLFAQHTDYIFSSMGEELGFIGCVVIMLMELAIIARCVYVGVRCQDYMRRLVCFGAASALMFQVMINVGMCIGVMPVIGLTLPLISYGGSSVVTIFAMLGLVSGAYARPQSLSHERYVQPYRG
ncbi:MAG TPA: FtsW/RodA/SpoVE family cell cycle protein [Candidatus Faecousia intestinavium]|nr:FtsW/RodA/SpoVE family cell cycle protein [Candidatus Faecousia intestinavium]